MEFKENHNPNSENFNNHSEEYKQKIKEKNRKIELGELISQKNDKIKKSHGFLGVNKLKELKSKNIQKREKKQVIIFGQERIFEDHKNLNEKVLFTITKNKKRKLTADFQDLSKNLHFKSKFESKNSQSFNYHTNIFKIFESLALNKTKRNRKAYSTTSKLENGVINESTENSSSYKIHSVKEKSKYIEKVKEKDYSIITDIKEKLNENYSSLTYFLNKDTKNISNDSVNNGNGNSFRFNKEVNEIKNMDKSLKNENINNEIASDSILNRKNHLKSFLEKVIRFKLLANEFFKKNKFDDAIKQYVNVKYGLLGKYILILLIFYIN